MRSRPLALLIALCAAPIFAAEPDGKQAKTHLLHGNYAEAAEAFQALAKADGAKPAAFVGWSRALQSQGEYDKAIETIDQGLTKFKNNADLLARRAEVLKLQGKWEEAEKDADRAIAAKDDQFLARFVKAEITRDRGEYAKAIEQFRWFVRTYTQRSNDDKEIKDPEELALVGRAATEYANSDQELTDQFDFILNTMYKDALKEDKDAWYIEQAAGELLLEKYNRGEALDAFDKALKINPRAAEALVGKAIAAAQKFEIKEAEELAEQALKINPKLTSAMRVKIDLLLLAGDLKPARTMIDEALKVNPREEETLARLGAIFVAQRNQGELDDVIARVTKFNPKPARFYYELAELAQERRLFTPAETYFKKAIEANPDVAWPRNGLGILYMRMGREAEARKQLDAAFERDKFNVRVANSRKVLKHLDKYKTLKTEHYEIRYDPEKDAILAKFMGDLLERLYADYAKQFNYSPKGPILVEVFNNHEMFSGRVVAVPDLHTIGACTGKMFAMVSPKGKGIAKTFNWGRVLRHELVHIFNLEQTDMQVPHWLTEGLAVANEGFAHPPEWRRVLAERAAADTLLNLDNITLGFVRPRSPDEWALSYCQANLYVEFIKKNWGEKAIGELLTSYGESKDDAAALKKACGIEKKEFEAKYKEYIKGLVKGTKAAKAAKPMTLTQLQKEHEKKPDDADIAARLAERLLTREPGKARKLAEAVLDKDKNHALASVVIAKLDAKAGRLGDAIKTLEAVRKAGDPDPDLLLGLGRLYLENEENDKAADAFEQGRKLDPSNPEWLVELARLYKKSDNKAKRISVLTDLVATDADEFEMRKLLAQLLLDDGKPEEAEKVARTALEIDLQDEEVHDVLFKSLKAQKKDDEAARLKKLLQD